MSLFHALLLGLIQGFTEFLPVSSSGHLALAEYFLGFTQLNQLVFFGLVCHLGTLGAIFTIFWKEIVETLKNKKQMVAIMIGTLPLFPLALLIKPLKGMFDRLDLIGYFFILGAFLIWLGATYKPKAKASKRDSLVRVPLFVGLFQALAILPGVSRSGSTISGGQMAGWAPEKAVSFSFLLAIPAILGGFTLELWQIIREPALSYDWAPLTVGLIVSYITGLFALKVLIRFATKKNLLPFAWYCLILGFTTLIYFNRP